MKPAAYITTSWDDGHPLDLRVADLLKKHGLPGTFYVPKTSEYGTISERQVRDLSCDFEIGAHTLNHVVLNHVSDQVAKSEIAGCKRWVEDVTGESCRIFCPPRGRYSRRHLDAICDAGFSSLRTTELLSLALPRPQAGLVVMPTTIQALPHAIGAYARNAIKRRAFKGLWRYAAHGGSRDWVKLAESLLHDVLEHGGVFHLWGHSWELEQCGQWQALATVLQLIGQATSESQRFTNEQICRVCALNPDSVERQNSHPDLLTTCHYFTAEHNEVVFYQG